MKHCRWTLHTLTDLSSDAVTSLWPSWEKATLRTAAVWALNTVDSPFLWDAQKITKYSHFIFVAKSLQDINLYTKLHVIGPSFNSQVKHVLDKVTDAYIEGVHSLTVLSLEEEATRLLDGENCTPVITSWCPTNWKALALGAKFHIIKFLSNDPEAGGTKGNKDTWRHFKQKVKWNSRQYNQYRWPLLEK